MIMEDTPTTSMENAADQAKREYDAQKLAVDATLASVTAVHVADRIAIAQVSATLALAAATRLQAEHVAEVIRQHLAVTAPAVARCDTRSMSGWRCPLPAGHDGFHTVDFDEEPEPAPAVARSRCDALHPMELTRRCVLSEGHDPDGAHVTATGLTWPVEAEEPPEDVEGTPAPTRCLRRRHGGLWGMAVRQCTLVGDHDEHDYSEPGSEEVHAFIRAEGGGPLCAVCGSRRAVAIHRTVWS